jgi:hypothetical protein
MRKDELEEIQMILAGDPWRVRPRLLEFLKRVKIDGEEDLHEEVISIEEAPKNVPEANLGAFRGIPEEIYHSDEYKGQPNFDVAYETKQQT